KAKKKKNDNNNNKNNNNLSLLLQVGQALLEQEAQEAEEEKRRYMEENCRVTPLSSKPSLSLQELCRKLHKEIDLVDEERYDTDIKVSKSSKEVCPALPLRTKVQDLKGKFKKPALKKVRMSADAMLAALLGSKHKVSMDLRANLKQVKKELREEEKQTADWRKNIEDKAGMDGRKKMFETDA
uniref:Troponin I type 2b (skeletal, fast), tandem duplicate 1 n=1 Tax=Myripristis murdjan TaxID=586833 RepID=A0A667ZGM4_9TELE